MSATECKITRTLARRFAPDRDNYPSTERATTASSDGGEQIAAPKTNDRRRFNVMIFG